MKKLLALIILLSAFFTTFAQAPSNRSSPAITAIDARLQTSINFTLPRYQDTTQANINNGTTNNIGLDSIGSLIFTRGDNHIWKRICCPKHWVILDSSASSGILSVNANAPLSAAGTTTRTISADTVRHQTGLSTYQQHLEDSLQIAANTAAITGKQAQLNGTGFVKASGTTITYDNTAYGTGTVTSFSKTDGFGIISSVSNPTTTPNHTIRADSTVLKTVYQAKQDSIALATAIALKLNISDTASMLTNYRNGINSNAANLLLKLNISDTSGMLTPYFRTAGLGLLSTGHTVRLDTSYGKKYFTWGLLVPNDSTVFVDSSKVASLLALQDSSAALRALSGGGGSVANPTASVGLTAVNGTATSAIRSDGAPALSQSIIPTWTGLHTFQKTATTPGGSNSILFGILSKPSFTASLTGDTLAGIVSQPVFVNTAFRYSFYGTSYDALINGVTIGGGNNNNIASQNTAIGFQAGLAFNNAATSANTAIGNVAGRAITSGYVNTLIGYAAGTLLTTGTYNTVIGGSAMGSTGTGRNNNTVIGATAGNALTGDQNCIFGNDAGRSAGSGNIMLGYQAGYLFAVSNRLYIQNSNSATPLIGGDFSVRSAGINKAGYTAAWHLPSGTSTAGSAPLKFSYDSLTTTATTGSAGIATISFASQAFAPFAVGSTIVIAGVTPSGYNATATVTACTTTSVSYSNATTAVQTVAGRIVQGQLMTAVENGAVEYDGADYYGSSASTRYKIAKTSTTGSNANMGTATLSGGTIIVNTTAVTATSKIFLTDATTGSLTNVGSPTVGTVTAGTSFVINSTNVLDASAVNWIIFN